MLQKMLSRKKILFCRSQKSSGEFEKILRQAGAEVSFFPTFQIDFAYPEAEQNARLYLPKLADFDWLVFSSVNGVEAFIHFIEKIRLDLNTIAELNIGVVGEKSALKLLATFPRIHIVAKAGSLQELLQRIQRSAGGKTPKVLHLTSEQSLAKIQVNTLDCIDLKRISLYRTIQANAHSLEILQRLQTERFDLIIFGSPTSFDYFREFIETPEFWETVAIATFGKTTRNYIRQKGYTVNITPVEATPAALLEAIAAYFNHQKKETILQS
jgi:uroporphyrinogen-III synthase